MYLILLIKGLLDILLFSEIIKGAHFTKHLVKKAEVVILRASSFLLLGIGFFLIKLSFQSSFEDISAFQRYMFAGYSSIITITILLFYLIYKTKRCTGKL